MRGSRASRAGPKVCLKPMLENMLLPRTISTNLVWLLELIAFGPLQ